MRLYRHISKPTGRLSSSTPVPVRTIDPGNVSAAGWEPLSAMAIFVWRTLARTYAGVSCNNLRERR